MEAGPEPPTRLWKPRDEVQPTRKVAVSEHQDPATVKKAYQGSLIAIPPAKPDPAAPQHHADGAAASDARDPP